MRTVIQRLTELMTDRNLKKIDLSNIAKVSPQAVNNWFKRGKVSTESARKICSKTDYSLDWLLFERGNKKMSENHIENSRFKMVGLESIPNNENKNSFYIEVLNITASAGDGYLNSDVQEVIKIIEYDSEQAKLLFNGLMSSNIKIINISGDSMQGTLESGDALYVDISKRTFEGDGIYVFTFGRGLYVKRLQVIKDIIRVKSDNKLYDPWEIREDEIDQLYIHGKVMLSQSMHLRKHG